jgi:long-chain acyl-CoA synthetase
MDIYRSRPWLHLYRTGAPADMVIEVPDALTMWRTQAAHAAQRPFIHYFGPPRTIAEVDHDSDALAAALAERGLGHGDRIALYMQNVPQFVVSLLATWKLGATAVPVNPMLKERELGYVLADCGAKGLICLQELWNSAAAKAAESSALTAAVTTCPLDALDLAPSARPTVLRSVQRVETPGADDLGHLVSRYAGRQPPPVTVSPEDVALLTYTSGTTGDPKGAMNTHANVVFNAHVIRDWLGLTAEDVCLAGAPLFHITGLIGHVAVAMLTSMPMVLGYRFEPATMIELTERHRATFTVLAITAYTAMMNDPSARAGDLSSLTKVYSCGSPIPVSTVERFEREVGPYIHNIYGLTETTAPSHAVPYGRRAPVDPVSGALSIGVPVSSTVARIIDENGDDAPVGELGEIAVSGPGVVPGYWKRPEATRQAMPGREMRTGDVGFMDPEGWFYLVDRKKDLIIASGYKVWPREVEDALLAHDAVHEAVVIGVPDEYRGETVKAFVSLRPDASVTSAELIDFCKMNLADYKYPRAIEIMDELPKTPTGKLLRRELRARA